MFKICIKEGKLIRLSAQLFPKINEQNLGHFITGPHEHRFAILLDARYASEHWATQIIKRSDPGGFNGKALSDFHAAKRKQSWRVGGS